MIGASESDQATARGNRMVPRRQFVGQFVARQQLVEQRRGIFPIVGPECVAFVAKVAPARDVIRRPAHETVSNSEIDCQQDL